MHVAQNDYSLCRELYCTTTQLANQRLKLHHERTYCIITTISWSYIICYRHRISDTILYRIGIVWGKNGTAMRVELELEFHVQVTQARSYFVLGFLSYPRDSDFDSEPCFSPRTVFIRVGKLRIWVVIGLLVYCWYLAMSVVMGGYNACNVLDDCGNLRGRVPATARLARLALPAV